MTMTNSDVDDAGEERGDRPRRRSFTAEYKARILAEYDGLTDAGAKGALLRREGLYSSHLVEWRKARDAGALSALAAAKPGPKPDRAQVQVSAAVVRAERAEAELARTRAALESVGKTHALLEMLSESAAPASRSGR